MFSKHIISPAILAAILAVPSLAVAEDTLDIYAGQHHYVGTLTVDNDADTIYVDYASEGDWLVLDTHLYIGEDAPKKGAPGQFGFGDDGIDSLDVSYAADLADFGVSTGDELYIAAHAVVQEILGYEETLDDFSAAITTDLVSYTVAYPGGDSYFNSTIVGAGDLDGTYDGFCVDTSRTIRPGTTYEAYLLSSYDAAAADLVDYPENLDLVNWVINQDYAGQGFTYGDIQRSIWTLIDDIVLSSGLGSWSQANVDTIVDEAYLYGEGYEPACDDYVAVIANPVNASDVTSAQVTIAQVTFAAVGLECTPILGGEETAWAEGDLTWRKGGGWGSYFTYEVQ
jgi:hypothetical protein